MRLKQQNKRKIVYVTGSRADYGVMRCSLRAIDEHPNLELALVVTGMHLLPEFGYTMREIQQDGFTIAATVSMLLAEDSGAAMAKSLGLAIIGMAQAFEEIKPDIILLEGDRGEELAAAIAGAHMNIFVAHMSGGDVTGSIDESIRHAVTKFAHIHFPGTETSAKRIIAMGEDPARVYMVGTPGVDLASELTVSREKIATQFGLDVSKPVILVVQHPVTTEVEAAGIQMRETMEAIVQLQEQTIVIFPNADAGGRAMIRVAKEYAQHHFIQMYESLPRDVFIGLLNVANVMVGNSSSGIVEALLFGLPVVNIGRRQKGRERGANVLDVVHSATEIKKAIQKALHDHDFQKVCRSCSSPYSGQHTARKVAEILSEVEIKPELLQKKFYERQ